MSYWNKDMVNQNKFALKENESTDVCIIGAGLAGLTTAYYLSKNKMKVVVLEANQICSGVSSRTTGKITSQHGLFYDYLVKSFGVDFARKYLEANEKAIKNIEEIINKEKIDCDFEKQSSYVFSDDENEKSLFEGELGALEQIGFNTKCEKFNIKRREKT